MQAYLQYRRIGQAVRQQLTDSEGKQGESRPGQAVTDNNEKIIVGWANDNDPLNPKNYSTTLRALATMNVSALAFIVSSSSSILAAVIPQNSAAFGVSDVVASIATGIFLLGFAAGSLISGPLSEVVGRNAVYLISLTIFMIFTMASGLSPNIGAQLAFRFLSGFFGCPPLTCAGGTIADLWNPLEKTLFFPMYAIFAFGGAVLGPVIANYMGQKTLEWEWTSWIILIGSGLVMGVIIFFQPETYGPLLLKWKAHHLRTMTGDKRYHAPVEIELAKTSLLTKMGLACMRQFQMTIREPIILLFSLYMTVIYIVLFTFLDGYEFIFTDIHGISQGLTNIIWVAQYVGIFAAFICVPFIYRATKREFKKNIEASDAENVPQAAAAHAPEIRLWFAMIGAPFIPISLFWMGWTSYSNISIWSPIIASSFFGFGTINIFISSYMYLIDAYDIYAASALGFMTVSRYCAAGGMTIVGIPFYRNMGVQYTLTILACISVLMVPVPYVFWRFGSTIRGWSRYAQN